MYQAFYTRTFDGVTNKNATLVTVQFAKLRQKSCVSGSNTPPMIPARAIEIIFFQGVRGPIGDMNSYPKKRATIEAAQGFAHSPEWRGSLARNHRNAIHIIGNMMVLYT